MTNLICILITSLTLTAHASTLFEGWFQVYVGEKKVGYSAERYEFSNNQFKCATFLKTSSDGNSVTESLTATSAADLKPVKYEYTSKAGDNIKVIDATFKADTMTLNIFDGKKRTQTTKRLKKGTFLSQFLMYLVLSQKNGLKIGNDFKYNAIAEEDGTAYTGSLLVKANETIKGKNTFRLINEFKDEKYITWVTKIGEPVLTRQPNANIDVRIADNQEQATEGFQVNKKDLELVFGGKLPGEGTKAVVATDETPSAKPRANAVGKSNTTKAAESGDDTKPSVPAPKPGDPGNGIEIKPPPKNSNDP